MNSENATCWTLIYGAAQGSANDRDDFARRYRPVVAAFLGARWRSTPFVQEVDDAIQELFVECFREDGVLANVESSRAGGFRAFLYGAVRNVARRFETRKARRRDGPSDAAEKLEHIEIDETSLSHVFDRAWAKSILAQALHDLVIRARASGERELRRVELLRLRCYDGKPIRDIAKEWNVDAQRLHEDYGRARREFRETLKAVVSFHCPGSDAEVEQECEQLLGMIR